jgi:hypothetical protein
VTSGTYLRRGRIYVGQVRAQALWGGVGEVDDGRHGVRSGRVMSRHRKYVRCHCPPRRVCACVCPAVLSIVVARAVRMRLPKRMPSADLGRCSPGQCRAERVRAASVDGQDRAADDAVVQRGRETADAGGAGGAVGAPKDVEEPGQVVRAVVDGGGEREEEGMVFERVEAGREAVEQRRRRAREESAGQHHAARPLINPV